MRPRFKKTAEKCAVCFFVNKKAVFNVKHTRNKEFNNSIINIICNIKEDDNN